MSAARESGSEAERELGLSFGFDTEGLGSSLGAGEGRTPAAALL